MKSTNLIINLIITLAMALREIKRYQQETNFLEEIMPTAIPTNSADLKRILNTIRL